ncbi:UNVERIFIED_CONTAM: hypothetical protein FKN15_014041 [Acipenser sinensis]
MKVRQSLPVTSELGDTSKLANFDGPDSKLMQNSGRTKFKRTSIDRLMNTLVLWIFGFLVCMGIILSIGNTIWERQVGSLFQLYLRWDQAVDNVVFSGFLSFWSYIIILNTVVPISLYVRSKARTYRDTTCCSRDSPGSTGMHSGPPDLLPRTLVLDEAASVSVMTTLSSSSLGSEGLHSPTQRSGVRGYTGSRLRDASVHSSGQKFYIT